MRPKYLSTVTQAAEYSRSCHDTEMQAGDRDLRDTITDSDLKRSKRRVLSGNLRGTPTSIAATLCLMRLEETHYTPRCRVMFFRRIHFSFPHPKPVATPKRTVVACRVTYLAACRILLWVRPDSATRVERVRPGPGLRCQIPCRLRRPSDHVRRTSRVVMYKKSPT